MMIDVHCHYTLTRRLAGEIDRFSFETEPNFGEPLFDSCVAPRVLRRTAWRLMRLAMGFGPRQRPGPVLDAAVEAWYAKHLFAPGPIDRHVLLAFDYYHERHGARPPLPRTREAVGSDIYTSNTLVRSLCRRHPERFLFGASVHPYRANAVACIDEVFAAGACLLKWLPQHQNIDCRDPRTIAVLRRCAALDLPVLVHYGPEFTLTCQHADQVSIAPLLETLRSLRDLGCMPPVIAAHVATPVLPTQRAESYELLVEALLDEFAEAPLYADISALTGWGKIRWLREVAARQELHGRLLFGTDFPVPPALPRLWRDLAWSYPRLARQRSWPQRCAQIFRAMGFNEIVFQRAASLLPNLDYFQPAAAPAAAASA